MTRTIAGLLVVASIGLAARTETGLDPATILKPLADSWPTYSGDYTGKRYSSLAQVNQTTVKNLSLAWLSRGFVEGSGPTGRGNATAPAGGGEGGGGRGGGGVPLIVGGEGSGAYNGGGPARITGTILMVDGVLYATSPDNLWAVDARDGTILWQYYWKTRGGTHTGHRGVGMWHDYLFMETHDNYLAEDRCAHGQGDLARRDLPVRPAVLLVHGADHHRRSRDRRALATTSMRPATSSRTIRRPASVSGFSTPCR